MRKIGLISAALGLVLFAGLYLLRQSTWFALEQAKTMSESGEIVESAFWASLLVILFGLFLVIRSFRRKADTAPQMDEIEQPQTWECPYCGTENSPAAGECRGCGMPYDLDSQTNDWVCPRCGSANAYDDNFCAACGYSKYGTQQDR